MTRRRVPRLPVQVTGLVGGGAGVGVSAYVGAPWWAYLCAVLCAAIAGVTKLFPQESEHRRDVLRDLLRHRERMYRLRHQHSTPTGREGRNGSPALAAVDGRPCLQEDTRARRT